MGGRQIPEECPHGRIVDWGDFGEPEDAEHCPECQAAAEDVSFALQQVDELREARARYDNLTTEVIRLGKLVDPEEPEMNVPRALWYIANVIGQWRESRAGIAQPVEVVEIVVEPE